MSTVTINRGICYALFAYDVALSINLDQVEQQISAVTQRDSIKHKHPAPAYFEYRPAPVRVTQSADPLSLGNYRSSTSVDLVLYDFGAVSVIYGIPLAGPFPDLLALSEELYDNVLLLMDSRRRVEQLVAVIRSAVTQPEISDLVEDYVIFQIEDLAMFPSRTLYHVQPGDCADAARRAADPLRARGGRSPISSPFFRLGGCDYR